MNIDLKVGAIRQYGTQGQLSRVAKISESRLSYLVRGYAEPTPKEREALKKALGADYFESQPPVGRLS